ncbi:MAG: amino acid racemase [Acidobacteria bacterium]|nr:amino acid racemase [Acidobacteriota bacterium]MCA1609538.1 amino acid racemase [Acidobacteriota bacterium]
MQASHIGIVACSAEGAALCYRTVCLEAIPRMGEHDHPRITLSAIPMARHMEHIRAGDWGGVSDLLLDGAIEVARAGAAFAICPDNTVHEAFPGMLPRSPIPWLHIAEVVASAAERQKFRRLGVLGTRYLMEGPVYRDVLARRGIEMRTPSASARETINRAIFGELVNAIFTDSTRAMFNEEIRKLREDGCDAAVLGCTEIPLIVRPEESVLPTLDSTRLLARAAVERALAAS